MAMHAENVRKLENLSWYCHLCGTISIFLGLVVTFMNLIDRDFQDIQVGFLIFIMGYAFVKISSTLQKITLEEKR